MDSIDLSACSALISIGASSYPNDSIFITLPVNSEYSTSGWRDKNDSLFAGDDVVNDLDLDSYYYLSVSYTLRDDDVEVNEGMIQSCSYNFALLHIIIPDTLDGQVVRGIADGEPWDFSFGRKPTGVFEGKEIVDVALPHTIEKIGIGSFRINRIENLDLDSCSSLSSLGVHAFYKNPLKVIDLLACNSLISIDYHTFYNYSGTSEFQLPAPDLPGYLFRHWVDSYQNIYNEGDLVRNFTLSYTAELSELFSVLIQVTDGNLPIQRAEVVFEGFDTLVTDSSGRIEIAEILPPTTLVYTVTAEGYDLFTDSITVHDKDVSVVVALELTTFSVFITVTDRTDPIEGAEVSMGSYGKTVTGTEGAAMFDTVRPWEELTCKVSAPGFNEAPITLFMEDNDLLRTIIMNRITGLNEATPSKVGIYPNPSSEKVYLKLRKKAHVQLIDTSGEVIMEKECSSGLVSLDVSHIPSGNYLIRIHMQNTTMIRKLVVL